MSTRAVSLVVCVALGFVVGQVPAAESPDEVPFVEGQPLPTARPNEGWTLVCKHAVYKTVTEQVEVRPAASFMEIVPAKFETKEETVMVQPERKVARVVPATYKKETFQVLVEPESSRYEFIPAKWEEAEEEVVVEAAREELRVIPAQYRTESERVEVSPAYTYWKKIAGGKDTHCDDAFCLCEAPAKYVTVAKQVLDKEATTEKVASPAKMKRVKVQKLVADAKFEKVTVPAKYATMERVVPDAPATVAYDTVPAKFETIQKRVMVEPESKRKVEIPAKFETISKQVLDSPARIVWRRIKCDCGEVVKKYKEIPGTDESSLMLFKK